MREFVNVLVQRIKSENPAFFKKLQRIAMIVMGIAAVVYAANYLHLLPVSKDQHDKINTLCYAIGTFFLSTFLTASTTTTDPNLVSPDTKKAIEQQTNSNI